MIETAVIIASWNGKELLKDCFDSLVSQNFQKFKIIFVDNGSKDNSTEFIEKNYEKVQLAGRLEFVHFKKNAGFARAYNAGIKKAADDENIKYFIILNNDTKLEEGCIQELVNCAVRHQDGGSIQPKVSNFFEIDRIDCAGILLSSDGVATNRGFGEKDHGQYDEETEIFGANGTASLFTRRALEKTQMKIGEYFDDDFFAYYEDVDLAWRLRLSGFKSYYCPGAKLLHIHSATANRISGLKAYYLNRNRFFTVIKNYPFSRLMLILFIFSPARYFLLLWRVITKQGRKGKEIAGQKKTSVSKEILRAWGSVLSNLASLLKKRKSIQGSKKVTNRDIARWMSEFRIKWSQTF